ncbi:MAG: PAS domain S-box protein [Balneolaceae bacterium]
MRSVPKLFKLNALSITLFYLVFALVWILLSDQALIWITKDPLLISRFQTFKGIFYVLITAVFLYILINKSNEKISIEKGRIDNALYAAGKAAWSIDLKTRKIQRSKFHYKLFGLSEDPEKWSLDDFYDHIHPEDREQVRESLERALQKETSFYNVEYRINVPGANTRWMQSRGNLVYDANQNPLEIAGVITDITNQKKLEEEYKRETELFERIFEQIPVMIDIYDPDINEIRVNKKFEDVLGWTNQEIQKIDLMEKCYPNPEIREKALQVMNTADGEWHEFELINKAGETRIQNWSNIRLSDNTIIGIGLDVTELKASQAEIRDSRELLRKTFESLKESVIILDPKTRIITDCNPETEEIFGYSSDELIGKSTEILHINRSNFKEFDELSAGDLRENGVFKTEYIMKKKDGSHFYSDHTVTLVKNDENEIEKVVSVVRDITEKKKYEEELEKLTDRYRNAEKIANIGHWERNLITDEAIWSDGYYEIIGMERRSKAPSYKELIEMIHPDDREEFDTSFKEALETGHLNVRYRLNKPSTSEVGWFQELATTKYNEDGKPVSISGTIQDTTEREEFQIKLKQRNDFIETTIENLPIGVSVNFIEDGTVSLLNKKFIEIYGWPKEALTDIDTFFENVYPDKANRNKIREMMNADIKSGKIERMKWDRLKITTQSGEHKIINAKNIPVYDQNIMISTVVDVTQQAEAERRLVESEHNYRLLFLKNPLPMWIYNPETLAFVEVNNAAIKHYGYTRKEFHQMTLMDIRPENEQRKFKEHFSNIDRPNEKSDEWLHRTKNGEIIAVNITGSSIDYFGNKYRMILVNDITEQKKAEKRVLASLVEGENKERARIARELHDGLGQYLAAANMNLTAIEEKIEKLDEREQNLFQKGLNLLKHAVTETGQISRNLMPRVVDDYGLAIAIEAMVDNYSSNSEMDIMYYQNIDDMDLPSEVEFNLYRIAQEGLSNAVKYSEATQINVQLIKDELDLILSIDDNGIGFDPTASSVSNGLGLQTIKTRSGALGGEFEVDSKPGKGTFINVIVPLKK